MIDLSDVPLIDNHVHPWRESAKHVEPEELAAHLSFADAVVASVREPFLPIEKLEAPLRLFRHSFLSSRFFLKELARFLDVDETWEAVAAARNALAEADLRAWSDRLFRDVRIHTLLVDEGGSRPRVTLQELGAIAPVGLRRVARLENFIRDGLAETDSWAHFHHHYQQQMDDAIADGAIAFKSVAAYRTGLDIRQVSEDEARTSFEATRTAPDREQKVFRDFLICEAMDLARERGLWFHIHAAVGDPDIQYEKARPALLYDLLHSPRFRENRVVLVHGGWPWTSEAAAMAMVLPNVYLDVSEGLLFGMSNLRQRIMETLEFCPYTKILYSADGSLPEVLWLGGRRYKSVLGRVLGELTAEGFFNPREAYEAGRLILSGNAARMYSIDLR